MLTSAHEWATEVCIHVLASLGSTQPFVVQLQLFLNVAIREHGIFVHLTISQILAVTTISEIDRWIKKPCSLMATWRKSCSCTTSRFETSVVHSWAETSISELESSL